MTSFEAFDKIGLGDRRLDKRFTTTLEQLSEDPTASISAACKDPHQAKSVYRLLNNDKVSTEAITEITRNVTIGNIVAAKPAVVLIPQDTTDFNYTNLKATTGLGSIGGSISLKGFYAHTAIAISESGDVFGALSQKLWTRPPENFGLGKDRSKIPIEDKESYRWLEAMLNSEESLPEDVYAVHLCDREGDIFEFYCKAEEIGAKYVCRNQYDRAIIDGTGSCRLNEHIAGTPSLGTIAINVPGDSRKKRASRDAELEIRCGKVTLLRPRNLEKNAAIPKSLDVYFVSAVEINVPEGQEGISWQFITNVPTTDFEGASTRIKWYILRWMIETFHRTLKSGCKVEEIQSESAEKLMKLVTIYTVIALRIMHLTYLARTHSGECCEISLTEEEWKILYKVANKTRQLPENPPTMEEAVRMIAKLGGFLGRKSDGFPGVTVIWRGLTKLYTLVEATEFLS